MAREPGYTVPEMEIQEIQAALSAMILSHSGWRGVFAAGEESSSGEIGGAHRLIVAGAAEAFAAYLCGCGSGNGKALALIGCDTRPTGRAIARAMIPVLLSCGCRVRYAGVVAAPEIMAWARNLGRHEKNCGFVYISASHNPIGHNGLKFGLADGGVLPAEETKKLTENFRSLMAADGVSERLEKIIASVNSDVLRNVFAAEAEAKKEALAAYFDFSTEVAWGAASVSDVLRHSIAGQPLGVCCDFNGSARCVSIDQNFFEGLGIQFKAINARPGEIVHRIVPEGHSLDPCCAFLEEQHRGNPAFVMGYVPDCDGDRGNLVIWDARLSKVRSLEAQEVFALACVAELAQLAWGMGNGEWGVGSGVRHAIAINDPTSLRVDRIAAAFGVSVFRAEVGEANVVGLARRLREEGWPVRIWGEGAAGGNITHPSAVRDPLHTVLALTKLLCLRTENGKPGLFELWCKASGQAEKYHAAFDLGDIIATLPPFVTTGAYSQEAVLNVTTADHGALKSRYQAIFLREWEERKDELKSRYGIYGWEAAAYNGMEERKGIGNFGEAGKGGLKICFTDNEGTAIASIWMRGSATEPVFRIMADGPQQQIERDLIEWQSRMTIAADRS
ncbi:MAG: phosphatidylglycerol lysyltransferase [Treponema sp.]|jgi:phosphoglucomutase|nr:phosphatidylglycerol lysyltransferase [Treponema sp.]